MVGRRCREARRDFLEGPDGAHKLTNTGEETSRVMLLSDNQRPVVVIYPDGNKIGGYTGTQEDSLTSPP